MENSFGQIEQRLANIEEKLDILIWRNENHKDSNKSSLTWRSSQELAKRLGLKAPTRNSSL